MPSAPAPLYVNYGCGADVAPGWLNFDASPTLVLETLPLIGALFRLGGRVFPSGARHGDIVKGLPVPPGSCAGVYASHVLEHLALADFRRAIVHSRDLLRPGGRFRVVVPDLEQMARAYVAALDGPDAATAAPTFLRETLLGEDARLRGPAGFLRQWLGHARHLWMWDAASLTAALTDAGFSSVRPARFGDSDDPRFAEVERAERFIGALAMEAVK